MPRKMNVGCGKHRIPGWLHVDQIPYGDNIVFNLDNLSDSLSVLPLSDNSVDEFIVSHVLEHLNDTLGCMEELWRVATPGAIAHVAVPFAFSEAAIEDQTHVKQFTFNSFCFFSQPVYCNADYGYRGDWHCPKIRAVVLKKWSHIPHDELVEKCKTERNICLELIADLVAIKPRRAQDVSLVTVPSIEFEFR